jgi:hypothetical protein
MNINLQAININEFMIRLSVAFILMVFLCITPHFSFGQNNVRLNCPTAISASQFQQIKRNVSSRVNSGDRYRAAISAVKTSCLNTFQLLDLLSMFGEDIDKLDLAIVAYPQLVNKEDVYDVYNAFAYFSTAFRYHDYVHEQSENQSTNQQVQVQPVIQQPVQVSFPSMNYPNPFVYQGNHNCNLPLSEGDFIVFVREIAMQSTEALKLQFAMNLASNSCLTTAQSMKTSTLLQVEQNRLTFLQAAYMRIYDEANFDAAVEVFSFIPNRTALMAYVNNLRATVGQPVPIPCELTDNKFSQIRSILAQENSSSSRLSIAKDQLPAYNCYSSQQIKELVKLFSASSDKLNLSKFAYDYVKDKDNYFFELSPLFSSSMDRQALSNYIASRKN